MSSSRLEKLKKANMTSDKAYPPFILYTYNTRIPTNEIPFETIRNDLVRIELKTGAKSRPQFFFNEKINKYYRKGMGKKVVTDVTDKYDWEKVLQKGSYPFEEFRIKEGNREEFITEERFFYPGSPQYDLQYPPIK